MSIMKQLLGVLFLLAVFDFSHPACFEFPRKSINIDDLNAEERDVCYDLYDGSKHKIGEQWRNAICMDCTCFGCCDAYSTPVNIPKGCVKEFDITNCRYHVFRKDNPNQSCPVLSAVGK
ncbi:beta-microseminoprotein-like [Polypterus senegalus]|uniref:beta-microseminoprotein-like n=1 Tax=Polypterus senegalus TaxID=55291 RepID=UPI001962A739|nr:beta-microseminoprotein-like [Polypterus senegalus]